MGRAEKLLTFFLSRGDKNMKKMYKYGIFVLAVVLVAAIASILVIRKNLSRDAEVFSEVRAYRTEVSADTEIIDDVVYRRAVHSSWREYI